MEKLFRLLLILNGIGCLFSIQIGYSQNLNEANPKILLQLEVGDPFLYVVKPDESKPISVVVTNKGNNHVDGIFEAKIESYDGSSFKINDNIMLDPGETKKVPIPRTELGKEGIKWVHTRLKPANKNVDALIAEKEMAFAYMNPVGNEKALEQEMLIGISYGAGPDNYSEIAAKAMSRVGTGLYRAEVFWTQKEPDWDWYLRGLRMQRKYGIEPYILLHHTAPFARIAVNGEKSSSSPAEPEAWRNYIHEFATVMQKELPEGQDLYWEVWNEPDIDFFIGTTDQYIEMLDIAHEEIKRVDAKDYHVMTGGFASVTHPHSKNDMIKRIILEESDNWEVFAYHRHGDFNIFIDDIENHLEPLLDKAGKDIPIFLTETGMDTRFGQHFQARELIKKIIYSWNKGYLAYTWFNLHDMREAEYNRQPGFTYGLYTKLEPKTDAEGHGPEAMDYENTYPKASYVALNTLNTVMQGFKSQKKLDMPDGQYVYTFSKDDQQVIVGWEQSSSAASTLWLFSTDADKAAIIDIMGNKEEVPVIEGKVAFNVSSTPSFLILNKSRNEIGEKTVLASTVPIRGEGSSVEFYNPFQQPVELSYEWQSSSVIEVADKSKREGKTIIQPNQKVTLSTAMKLKSGNQVDLGSVFYNRLTYKIEPYGLNGSMEIPHKVNAVSVPASYQPWINFAIDRQEQVVNVYEHDPHTAHLMWSGTKDKSLSARLARNHDHLNIKTTTQDDLHYVDHDDLKNGDCVILELNIPGQDGIWRWAITHLNDQVISEILSAPEGYDPNYKPKINLTLNDPIEYELIINEEAIGLNEDHYKSDLRFNVKLIDHDGNSKGIESYMYITPVTEGTQPEPEDWTRLILAD